MLQAITWTNGDPIHHIVYMCMCVSWPQDINSLRPSDPYMRQYTNHH